MHGTRVKLKTLESSRLDYIYIYIYTCPPGSAGKSSKRREGICLLYICIYYIYSYIHFSRCIRTCSQVRYLYGTLRTDLMSFAYPRIKHAKLYLPISFSRAMIRGTRKRTMVTLTLYGMLQWAWRHFRNIQALTARRKLGR